MNKSADFDRIRRIASMISLIGALAAIIGIFISSPRQFFQSYLVAYITWLSLSLGLLAITMLHYLVGGNWGRVIRRILEAGSKTLWLVALMFVPVALGVHFLYPWSNPAAVAASPILQHKSAYLNIPFFIIRAGIYFVIWGLLTWLLVRWAGRPEYFSDPLLRRRLQRLSAIGIILYVLTISFASVDWVMSLHPEWFSTIFGFMFVVGQGLAGMAFAILVLPLMIRTPPLAKFVTPGHFRDLGALLFTMVLLWAYISFSQFFIIWAGNLPHEVVWYLVRSTGGWVELYLAVIVIQFILPFIALLSLRGKRNLRLLAGLSAAILVMRFLDYFWLVKPSFSPNRLTIHWLDLVIPVAMGGLWIAAFFWHLKRTPQATLPVQDAQHANTLETIEISDR